MPKASRDLVRSMLVIGSSQGGNILVSLVRMKLLAVLLGPSGVGLLSIYNSLKEVVTQTAGLGMGQSGVREIASARDDLATQARVRRVLFAAHLVQGSVAMVGVWLLRVPISTWLLGDAFHATEVGLVGATVLLALMASAQIAILQGLRRIGDLGRVTIIGAVAGTAAGLAAVWAWGEAGLIWFLLVQPLASVLVALVFTRRLPKRATDYSSVREIWRIWKPMAWLGGAFMLGGLATTATLLLVRSYIIQEMGMNAAGQFAAAWSISMTYVGFLLGAMGADYYPRLTEVIENRVATVSLMNDQMQLGLAIGGPVLLLLIGLAPLAITLLYSAEFGPAATLLQWQAVGNVFKLASWALGFSVIASARSKTFLLLQINFNVLFLLMLWPTLSRFGIIAAGPTFTIAYMIHFVVIALVVRVIHGFIWQPLSLGLLGLHVAIACGLLALALVAPLAAALAAPPLAVVTGLFGLGVVLTKIGDTGRLSRLYAACGWPIRSVE